jgi:hypothetical protein
MKKITNIREQILYSRNGEFTIQELSELAEPRDILSVALNGWEATIYKHVQREETDEEYERRLLQELLKEQYQEDWKKYQELKLKFHL